MIAIIITIMVLELKVPHGSDLTALASVAPHFASYVLSFIYIGIYWNNHHHLLHTVHRVDGLILWANAHLLFWLSLVPAATAWLGENFLLPTPTALYSFVLLLAAFAYYLLQLVIVHRQGKDSVLASRHPKHGDLRSRIVCCCSRSVRVFVLGAGHSLSANVISFWGFSWQGYPMFCTPPTMMLRRF